MYTKSAAFYDAIYESKDYATEAATIHALIQKHKQSAGSTLLDAGCGTGGHFPYLRQHYTIDGLDIEPGMLAVARERFPDVVLHQADMADFDLNKQFDVVVCLFSSIAYVVTLARMQQTIANFSRHTRPGGVVIVEPWYTPDSIDMVNPGQLSAGFGKGADFEITRMTGITVEGRVSVLNFRYQVTNENGSQHLTERHEMGLFTHEEHVEAFRAAELEVEHDSDGLIGRGLYIGYRG